MTGVNGGHRVGDIDIQQIGPSLRTGTFRLPPDIDDFTGRDEDLRLLRGALEPRTGRPNAAVVSAIAGRAGVGKTALATRVAHQLRPSFPDGQLYVNLRGSEPHRRLKPADVLAEFLLELGVARAAIPERLDQRAARYRAQLADRRVLVVLDNAADAAQVRPLLPGGPRSAALITSRAPLGGLEATHAIVLDVLEPDQAIELLAMVVGRDRVAAEPEAARAIVELCGYLPLAVRIAGAKLAASRRTSLAAFAGRLAGEHDRLAEFRMRDPEVRASFALNYQDLPEDERRAFRLLALHKGPDFTAWVAAALLDGELVEAERLIERLVKAEVLEVAQETPIGQTRYRFHDLLHGFARERLWTEESRGAQESALRRSLDAYLDLAARGAELLEPGVGRRAGAAPPPARLAGAVEQVQADPAAWFEAERINLIAAVEQASDNGLWELSWRLARSLTWFFRLRTHWTDWQLTAQLGLRAARRAQDRQATADALSSLGDVSTRLGRFRKAVALFEEALALFRELGDRRGEAWALVGLGGAHDKQGSFDQAVGQLDHGLALFRGLGDRRGEAWALVGLGDAHRVRGGFDEALACFEQGLALMRAVGDRRGEAYCLLNLGMVHLARDDVEAAPRQFEQAVLALRELGDRLGLAKALSGDGLALAAKGDRRRAADRWREAAAIFRELGAPQRSEVEAWLAT